tara:strand:+ start:148 stop:627 length:480 start_codon:yes stop_codon:yes gene_type:complete
MPGNCKIGSRLQVWNGTCEKTAGGLKQSDLMMNKNRSIVSKKASKAAKKSNNLDFWIVKKSEHNAAPKNADFSDYKRPRKGTKAYNDFKKNAKKPSTKKKSSKKKSGKKKSGKKKSSKKKSSKKKSGKKKIRCGARKSSKKCRRAYSSCKWSKKKCSKK